MNSELLKDFGLGIVFVISQILFFQHLNILGTTVDPIIFFLLWLIPRYERSSLLFMAAALGLIQDAFFDFWGMFMFSKTLLVFLLYNFVRKRAEIQLLLWQIFLFIWVAAIVHNLIFFGLNSFFEAYAVNYYPFLQIVGGAIYTALVGSLIYVFRVK
ncbi:MAG: rod shape-determining protein MreD [Balneola sp.]|nr:MAG: rod shape-determining protein MreD [Balneola sp.]